MRPAGSVRTRSTWIPPTSVAHDRTLALEVGGWRPPWETGIMDPEADLCHRMSLVSGPPHWMSRLTSVKPPASFRSDVYRNRPQYEQEAWLRRIRRQDDPEATFTGKYRGSSDSSARWIINRVRSMIALRMRLRRLGLFPSETAEDRRLVTRAFKGLD